MVAILRNFFSHFSGKELIVLLVCNLIILGYFTRGIANTPISDNDISRLGALVSIVRYNEFNIDKTAQVITGDKVFYDGKYYSSKPPALTFITGYIIKHTFSLNRPLLNNDIAIYRMATFLTTVLPILGIFNLLYLLFRNPQVGFMWNIIFSLFGVFGTIIFSYSSYLNNHILLAFVQLAILALLIKRTSMCLVLGILLSLLYALDNTYGLVFIPIMFIYLLSKRRDLLNVIIGMLPFTILHFYLSWAQFHTLVPPQNYPEIYLSYPGSKWVGIKSGMAALNDNYLVRFFNYSFGTYGFFLYSPLMIYPFLIKKNYHNKLFLSFVIGLLLYLVFNTLFQADYGGSSFGARRFIPLILVFYYYAVKDFMWKKLLFILLAFLNMSIALVGYTNPWSNWEYYSSFNMKSEHPLYFPLLYTLRKLYTF